MAQKPWFQLIFVLGEAALTLLSSGVLFIIISRVGGAELLGTYALAYAWLMLFQAVSCFGIPEYLIREVGAFGRDAAAHVVHAMLLGLASGVAALCLMLAGARMMGYAPDLVDVITVTSLALFPAFLNTACRSVFLALREMHLTFMALLAEVTIMMSASLYLLLSGHGAIALMVTVVIAKTASAALSLFFLFFRIFPVLPVVDKDFLFRTARTVFAFGIGSMLGMLSMRINMIMVSAWVDIATVGYYAAASKIMEIGLIIPTLFAQLLMSRIAYSFNMQGKRDPNRFGSWYQTLFALVMPICVGGFVFAGPILEKLFGAGFGNTPMILRVLMIYLLIESADSVMSVILKAARLQRQDVSRQGFNLLTNILLNLALLPGLGAIGAAIGRVGGSCGSATLRYLLISRELVPVNWLSFAFKPALISLGVGAVCYALLDTGRPMVMMAFYVVATAGLLKLSSVFSFSVVKDMMSFPSGKE